MVDELEKYTQTGHFFFKPSDNLGQVCNAQTNMSGVYIVYALKDGRVELIFVGCSGEVKQDGTLYICKAGPGGFKDRLVNGKQFGEPRRNSWKAQMLKEGIEALDVYWFVTHCDRFVDSPRAVENKLFRRHYDVYGRLPKWNNEL
jgi:hypothetical protein